MIYVSVQPDINYFHWQVELYLYNFLITGINPDKIHVIFLVRNQPSPKLLSLREKWKGVHFFFHEDCWSNGQYIASRKPWGMYCHLKENPSLENESLFYHDSDIIFREKVDETVFEDKQYQYMSDTISYVGYDYCLSKGEEQLKRMAATVGIPVEIIHDNQQSSGGAQYVLTGTTKEYWGKVYDDSKLLYSLMESMERQYVPKHEGDYPIQKWCAEMWATLWNLWYFRKETKVVKELDFCSSTDPIDRFYQTKIMHNAGVTDQNKHYLFYKGGAIDRVPFNDDFSHVDAGCCSWAYVQNIKKFVANE